ncbi:O-antigen ligase family protein [Noviherbaspirillum galbum]|uniref:O-antigen ligase family protein n=1 Tax=Noviherbaspirillum galbum TaxID=2709383 RepID=A0A6B3SPH3_9BURK|nr:O-antigen ligase family protein [Noviherbaspirillum galbum]NEX62734.1 O-antigen ligase family protein [Noviherbaspirillum galbum]
MNDTSLATLVVTIAGAAAAGMIGLMAVGVFIGINRQFGKWTVALINPLILLAMCGLAFLSGRNVSNAEFEIGTAAGAETAQLTWFLRIITAAVLGVCLARFLSAMMRHEAMPREGRGLFFAFLAFYISNFVLNNLFGTRPVFDQKLIYPLLVTIAVYLSRSRDARMTLDATKSGLLFFCIASCAAIYLLPNASVQQGYDGVIPGVGFRLWGLGSNPNSTGPLAVILLLLLARRPFRNVVLQLVGIASGLAVLALSQSKTAWLAAALAFPTLWWGKMMYASATGGSGRRAVYPLHRFLRPMLVCVLGLAAVTVAAYLMTNNPLAKVAIDQQEQVTTLTGRTEIWNVAIETWKQSPLFGYGSAMWDEVFRRQVDMAFAYNAHNQFLQSLSVAGAVGLAGMVVYVATLFRYAFAANTATRGLSLALFWVIFVRLFTEAPFNMAGIFSGEFVTHVLLFTLVLTKGREVYFTNRPAVDYAQLQNLQYHRSNA